MENVIDIILRMFQSESSGIKTVFDKEWNFKITLAGIKEKDKLLLNISVMYIFIGNKMHHLKYNLALMDMLVVKHHHGEWWSCVDI